MFKNLSLLLALILLVSCSHSDTDNDRLQTLDTDATILAFGDSLTYGTGASRDKAYPVILENMIGHRVINAGVPGEVSNKGLFRLPGLIDQYKPDLIILCHGGNDIIRKLNLRKTAGNLQQMIDIAKNNHIQIVLIGVPEFGLFLDTSPIYEELADINHIPIASDILGDILGDNSLKADRVHPNGEGYKLLAETIALLLKKKGALPAD